MSDLAQSSLSAVIGALTGILSSGLVWWYSARVLVPKLRFSDGISKRPDFATGQLIPKYRIKIQNNARRDAVDLDVQAVIRFPSRDPSAPENIQLISIGAGSTALLLLSGRKSRTINIKPEAIPTHQTRHFSPEIRERLIKGERVPLEDILGELGPEARVRIYVRGHDGVSGARMVFTSPDYSSNEIYGRQFDPNGVNLLRGGPM